MSAPTTWGHHFGEHKVKKPTLLRFQEPPRAQYVEHATPESYNIRNGVAYDLNFGPSSFINVRTFEYAAPMAPQRKSGFRAMYGDGYGNINVCADDFQHSTGF